MVAVTGSFKLVKSENFEEYMKAVGVGAVMRKLAATATPTTEITQSGDEWRIKTMTTFKTTDIKFKLGQEFDEETGDGRKCKSTITLEGNKLVHKQKVGDNWERVREKEIDTEYLLFSQVGADTLSIIRDFSDEEMKMTLDAPGGVISTRIYKRL